MERGAWSMETAWGRTYDTRDEGDDNMELEAICVMGLQPDLDLIVCGHFTHGDGSPAWRQRQRS